MAKMITLLDGGMGRELMRSGAPFRQPEWSALALMVSPEYVSRVHQAFVTAGCDVLTTNSYALVPFHIGNDRFAREGSTLADRAGRLARAAAGDRARVAGSLPPVFGSYRPDLFDNAAARPILATLIDGLSAHVDLWLAETLSAVAEAEAVAEALASDPRPLWLSFTLADTGAAPATGTGILRSGEPIAEAVRSARRHRAHALLFNCSQPEVMESAVREAASSLDGSGIAVGVYANAFPPTPADAVANEGLSDIRADLDPARYVEWAELWVRGGATIVGGCCGVGPEHIAALAHTLRPD